MIDYKNRHFKKSAPRKAAHGVGKKRARRSGQSKQKRSGKFPYLLLAGVIVLLTWGYISYQIKSQSDSVFVKLYELVGSYLESSADKKGGSGKTADQVKAEKTAAAPRRTEHSPGEKRAAAARSNSSIQIYVPKKSRDGKSIVIVPSPLMQVKDTYLSVVKKAIAFTPDKEGVLNVFQPATKILNAEIENGILLLNFNEYFGLSRYGRVGANLQVQQILWTVFKYSESAKTKISRISFLLNGERKTTFGGEGIELKLFYSKNDCRRKIVEANAI